MSKGNGVVAQGCNVAVTKAKVEAQGDVAGKANGKSTPSGSESLEALASQLVERAEADGVSLVGPGGLLSGLTKTVLESALNAEMTEHLGYDSHEQSENGNSRNGTRSKKVITEAGPVEIDVPRDRDASFEPKIVRKRQRRLNGIDGLVISLSAKGLTHGEICAHLAEIYGAEVSKDTISRITDRVLDGMTAWQNRPLDRVYPVMFIDAIVVKIREGAVANRPIYVAVGVTVDGERDILGLWAGEGSEGAKYWLHVLTEVKNRGTKDVCIVVCDGLKGLVDSVNTVWPEAIVQTCVIHLIRNTFRYASKQYWGQISRELKPIYTARTQQDARAALDAFAEVWGEKYPAIIRLWENAWAEFVPFLEFDPEIRKVIYTTNAVESLNARFRRSIKARGHFPTEQAAMKCLYLTIMSLDPKGEGRQKWVIRWKAALNAFSIAFEGRIIQPNE